MIPQDSRLSVVTEDSPHEPDLITVFTPTYNRADRLPLCYKSLLAQTYRNFYWLIIDGGSTDNTRSIVEGWKQDGLLRIEYHLNDHEGYYQAMDNGFALARTEFVVVLDSDDTLAPNALRGYLDCWYSIPAERRPSFAGVKGLCIDEEGNIIGDAFPDSPWDANTLIKHYQYRIRGDKRGLTRKSVWLECSPDQPPYCLSWPRISRKYKTRYTNEALYIAHTSKSIANRMTTSGSGSRDVAVSFLQLARILREDFDFLRLRPLEHIVHVCLFADYGIRSGKHVRDLLGEVRDGRTRAACLGLFYPILVVNLLPRSARRFFRLLLRRLFTH